MDEMVGVVVFENMVMHQRVPLKGIAEKLHEKRAVHEIAVQRPFEKGRISNPGNNTDSAPKKKRGHKLSED